MNIASMEVSEGGTRLITDKGQQKTAKLIIAADGANSIIRELCRFPTREWEYNHNAIVTTVKTELAHQQTALQRFIDTGPLAFLPLAVEPNDTSRKMPFLSTKIVDGVPCNEYISNVSAVYSLDL